MLVKLTQGFTKYYDGKKRRLLTYKMGPADVPDGTARHWIARGAAVAVDAAPETATPEPTEPETAGDADVPDYGSMTVRQLRAECSARGIRAGSAGKAGLIGLLEADDRRDEELEPLAPEG